MLKRRINREIDRNESIDLGKGAQAIAEMARASWGPTLMALRFAALKSVSPIVSKPRSIFSRSLADDRNLHRAIASRPSAKDCKTFAETCGALRFWPRELTVDLDA